MTLTKTMTTTVSMSEADRDALVREVARHARLDAAQVRDDAHLISELGLSSVDLLTLLAFVEDRFAVRFPDEMLGELLTLERIVAAIAAQQAARPTGSAS